MNADSPSANARQKVRIHWGLAILCAAILAFLSSLTVMPRVNYAALPRFPHTILPQVIQWGTWLPLIPLVFGVARLANVRSVRDVRGIALLAVGSVFITVVHIALNAVLRQAVGIGIPQNLLVFIPGLVKLSFANNFIQYWLITGAYYSLAYHNEVRERAVNEERMATRLAEARLEALESRMHPHFLFNTLNAIAALIHRNPPAAATMVGNLGDLLRAALNAEPGRRVSLAHELELLDRYVEIQKARFSDRLSVVVDAPENVLAARVPHMLLQPLVENSIRHGIAPREAPGTVTVVATRRGDALRLVVRDDGVGFGRGASTGLHGVPVPAPATTNGSGFGINSTRARLVHLYGNDFSFEIGDAEPNGTVVTIDLPFSEAPPSERSLVA